MKKRTGRLLSLLLALTLILGFMPAASPAAGSSEYDRSFTVTVDGAVVPEEDVELVPDGYAYRDMITLEYAGTVDVFVVTVPQGTETALLTFTENRLVYNYTAEGDYLGGYYEDYMTGASTAEVPLDYGDDSIPADGVPDYLQVQTPYYDGEHSTLLYAVTFRWEGAGPDPEDPEQPEEPEGPSAAAAVRDAIAARYASCDFSGDQNVFWLTADMMAYLAAFPDTEYRLSDEQKQILADKAIETLATTTSQGDAAKCVVALSSLGCDLTQLTTAEGETLNGREILDGLCFDGGSLVSTGGYYSYTLPYLIIAYQQFDDADEALEIMIEKALKLKIAWMNTRQGTDGLTPFMLALAPYAEENEEVGAALNDALAALKKAQKDDGSLGSSAASTGLALAGLVAMGIDPREIVSAEGNSLVDGLLAYATDSGDAFKPTTNSFSTEQGFRGLIALAGPAGYRVYGFNDKASEPEEEPERGVIFVLEPENAAVVVTDGDGAVVEPSGDNSYLGLAAGSYGYIVSLEGYEDESGEFTVTTEGGVQTIRVSLTPSEQEPEEPPTAEEIRDAIAAKYASYDFSGDQNVFWLTADMMAYLAAFPDTEYRLSEEQKQILKDKAIDVLAAASSASDAAKAVIALASLGFDPTRLTTGEGKSLNGREKLDSLCFNGDALIGTDGAYYHYSLPYLMIAYQQFSDADEALAAMIAQALASKDAWLETTWGTDGLTPFMLALAPYAGENEHVRAALDEALEILRASQLADGSLGSSAASTGLALAGLVAMGVDPAEIVSAEGRSLVDGLLAYAADTGDGFKPTSNSFSTEQGFRGLIALANAAGYRIYDFQAEATDPGEASPRDVVFTVIPENAEVTVWNGEGAVVAPSARNAYSGLAEGTYTYTVSLEGYEDKSGEFTVTAEGGMQTISVSLARSEPEEDDEEEAVTVTVYVLAHDGETCGNSLTYKSNADEYYSLLRGECYYATLTAGEGTARDALIAALEDSGVAYVEESNGYFFSIGDYEEKSHGSNSGWMYLVDGESPPIAANGYVFEADAEMIWYFTDDYIHEYGSEEFNDEEEDDEEEERAYGAVLEPEAAEDGAGNAEASVTAGEILGAIEAAAESGYDEIAVIPVGTENSSSVTVSLPREGLEALAEDGAPELWIGTAFGDVLLSGEALRELVGEIGETLSVTVEKAGNMTGIALTADGRDVSPAEGVTVSLPGENLGPGSVLVLADGKGQETVVRKCVPVNGRVKVRLAVPARVRIEDRSLRFDDTAAHWAKDAVDFVSARGLMTGVGVGEFAPDLTMTRAMFAAVLFRLEDAAAEGANAFADVAEDAWYRDAVVWAAGAGIVKGKGSGFDPDGEITREEIAVMLCRYAAYLGMDTSASGDLSAFTDGALTHDWAKDGMLWAVKNGLVNGKGAGILDPGGSATRAEVAAILQRMIGLIAK